jgi:hypothetical protein
MAAAATAIAPTTTPTAAPAVDNNYRVQNGESMQQYNTRVAAYNADPSTVAKYSAPTVVSNANVIEKTIPALNSQLTKLGNTGSSVGPDGSTYYADGTMTPPPALPPSKSQTMQSFQDQQNPEQDQYYKQELDLINSMKAKPTPSANSTQSRVNLM